MSSTRALLRPLVGARLGRGYYASSTCLTGSTSSEIVDTKRVEFDASWEGASLFIPSTGEEAVVTSNDPDGRLFLAQPLTGGAPVNGTPYELLRGWRFADLNASLGQACAYAYPWAFTVVNDSTTVTETDLTPLIQLPAVWRIVTGVRRQQGTTTNPTLWQDLVEGVDYQIRQGAAGLEYETRGTPSTGTKLWFTGEGVATIAAPEASAAARVDDQVLIDGALWYLWNLGPDPAEPTPSRWEKKAADQWQVFQNTMRRLAIPREAGKIRAPKITVVNDGTRSGVGA